VPLTFFAHQAPVIPLKLARPRWFDGTALCVGSMAPDLSYPFGALAHRQGHTAIGVVVWALPVTLVICWAIRRWVAGTAFAQLPDLGPFRVHSYRVLARGRPALAITMLSALIGATVHVVIDAFTHADRWGAQWLGYDDVVVHLPGLGDERLAHVFQLGGHTVGSLIGVALVLYIGARRQLDEWYGADAVAEARSFTLFLRQRVVFWVVVATAVPLAALWIAYANDYRSFRVIVALALTTAVAAALPVSRPVASPRALVP
jgi:hypothetical protein